MTSDGTIGRLVRELRQAKGWKQQQLARELGLSAPYLSQIERGVRPVSRRSAGELHRVALAVSKEDGGTAAALASTIIGLLNPIMAGSGEDAPLVDVEPAGSDLVGLLAPGRTRQVAVAALGTHDGDIWIDPAARTGPVVVGSGDPRLRRSDDGQLRVDVGRLPFDALTPRDPRRHFIPVVGTTALEGDPVPYDEYLRSVLEVDVGGQRYLVRAGTDGGPFPADVAIIHLLSAANPWPHKLTDEENARRMRDLRRHLADALGPAGTAWGDGHASAPDVSEALAEDSVVLWDRPRAEALEIARTFQQRAIFEWTRDALRVVEVTGTEIGAAWTSAVV